MRLFFTILILFLYQLSHGQQAYEAHEVEQQARPAGGMVQLGEYLQVNLRIPIASAAKGINGRVFVQGIVEPNGAMTELKVLRSISPPVDREVLRVLSLFRAWKPAIKGGQPVRQRMVYPAQVRTEPIAGYDTEAAVLIEYFDKKNMATTVESEFRFRNYIPVDSLGYARDNLQYQQKKGDGWKTLKTVPFSKEEAWVRFTGPKGADSLRAVVTSTKDQGSPYEEITRLPNGQLLAFKAFQGFNHHPIMARFYYHNGGIRQEVYRTEVLGQKTEWYPNGQIRSVIQFEPGSGNGPTILQNWAEDGRQLVVDGQGTAILTGLPKEGAWVFESGLVKDGKQEGQWTGRLADSTLLYEEEYLAGVLQSGTGHLTDDAQHVNSDGNRPPQFEGGTTAMYQFMGANIHFPGSRPQGRVVTTFMVQPDGSIKGLRILESLSPEADKEALRVIGLMDGKWEPARYKGQPIASSMKIPLNFQVQ